MEGEVTAKDGDMQSVCIGKVASVLLRLSVSSTWESFLLFGRAHSPETVGAAVYSASSAAREWLS